MRSTDLTLEFPGSMVYQRGALKEKFQYEINYMFLASSYSPFLIPRKQKVFKVHLVCFALSWMRNALIHFFSRAEPILNSLWDLKLNIYPPVILGRI